MRLMILTIRSIKLALISTFTLEYSTVVFGVVRLYFVRSAFIALLLSGRSALPNPSCPKGTNALLPLRTVKLYRLYVNMFEIYQNNPYLSHYKKVKVNTMNTSLEGLVMAK